MNFANKITTMNKIMKIGLYSSFSTGFVMFMFPNTISIKINKKHCYTIDYLPLVGGCLGVSAFILSPFLITNYFLNGTYFDKLYDNKLYNKYDINIERYHQYGGINDGKYAFPSYIQIEINEIEINKEKKEENENN